MAKTKKEDEVIKVTKETKKIAAKEVVSTSNKIMQKGKQEVTKKKSEKNDKSKEGLRYKIGDLLRKNKLFAFSILAFTILVVTILPLTKNNIVLTIDGVNYTKDDYMIYLYSVKYNYFGKDNTSIPEATLNAKVNDSTDITIKEYLKEKTTNELKTAAVIKNIAKENNIKLTKKARKELKEEKEDYIKSLGGKSKFKKLLRDNHTTEKAYDNMATTDKLYELVLSSLYGNGKLNDLTLEEKETFKNEYYTSYKKIKQIILATIDTKTNQSLNTTLINQKKALAETIRIEAENGVDFDELIQKYSEDAIGKKPPFDVYYKDGELLSELDEAVDSLKPGDISNVIKTKYAFHIIEKQKLDEEKLEEFYDDKREEKLLKYVSENLENLSIIYQNNYDKLKIN